MKRSILFIAADKFPPFRVDTTVLMHKELTARLGYRIDWFMQSDDARAKRGLEKWDSSHVYVGAKDARSGLLHRLRKRLQNWRNDLGALQLIKVKKYDFVQVKDRYFGGLIGLTAARLQGCPFIFWLSFPAPEASVYRARNGMAPFPLIYLIRGHLQSLLLYKVIMRRADHIIAQSEQMRSDLIVNGIDGDKITAVPMGIDLDLFTESIRTDSRTATEKFTVGYLGSLAAERRIDFLVRVLAIVQQSIPNARLLLVGGGDRAGDENIISAEAQRLSVTNCVEFTGRLPHDQAIREIGRAQVCASPFFPTPILNSTSPTKLVEYMALEKPVVANDHPEQRLIVEESGAGRWTKYDEHDFAAAVADLLAQPELCTRLGQRGYRYVLQHRSYKHLADTLDRTYTSILEDRRC